MAGRKEPSVQFQLHAGECFLESGEEDHVEGHGFGECHAENGLNEDLAGSAGVAADGLNGFLTDETHAESGTEGAKRDVDVARDAGGSGLSDDIEHDYGWLVVAVTDVRTLGTLPSGNG